MQAAQARQQVLAHNIGNLHTPGYKADDVTIESFEQVLAALSDPLQPGTGAVTAGRRFDLGQGPLEQTGGPLDAALDGDGFFVLQGPDGPLYTRTGRFGPDAAGTLRSADGLAVQGADGAPRTMSGAEAPILPDATVLSDGVPVGRLAVVTLEAETLTRAGTATFTSSGTPAAARARVVSGALEGSNVDPTATMTAMTMLLRAFESGRQAMQLQNETLNAAVNQVGSLR